jgi:hypothetical protein
MEKAKPMANDTIVDIYCHIMPEKFSEQMSRIAPRLGNIAARLRGVKTLFDLDERFREMDQFGDYREIILAAEPADRGPCGRRCRPRIGTDRQ